MQPEIKFIRKLINMRLAMARKKAVGKSGAEAISVRLKLFIDANKYELPFEAKLFFKTHRNDIEYLIPSGMQKLKLEYEALNNI